MAKAQTKRLGRGLSALLGEDAALVGPAGNIAKSDVAEAFSPAAAASPVTTLPIEAVRPNPDQPRRHFDETALDELAASIRERGIIQPIIVRPDPAGDCESGAPEHYQIVAGERRWRAAQRAQLHEVPVVVRELADRDVLEIAIVENVQRADLNPVEEAQGYAQLIDSFAYTQEELARVIGKSRSHLANSLRLLALPDEVRAMLEDGRLSAGHARAVATAPDPAALAREVAEAGLSVREAERRAKAAKATPPGTRAPRAARARRALTEKDADTRMLEGDLAAALGMPVFIDHRLDGEGGKLTINYRSLDDLDALCRALAG